MRMNYGVIKLLLAKLNFMGNPLYLLIFFVFTKILYNLIFYDRFVIVTN